MHTKRSTLPASLVALLLATVLAAAGISIPAQAQEIRASALQQIADLQAEKASRSPALRKADSRLVIEHRMRVDPSFAFFFQAAVPQLRRTLDVRFGGLVLVDVHVDLTADAADESAAELVRAIDDLGGDVESVHTRFGRLRAWIDLDELETLASRPEVRWIRPADVPIVQGGPESRGSRRPHEKMTNTTEGDVAHAADTARATFNVDGTGVTGCAMSDSVDALADVQASGDLPGTVTVLPGQSGNPATSEGTALLEILHDMAPGAALAFATGLGGEAQMAQNILDLRDLGCDVIVDDILYLGEPVFQDGVIAQAVTEVVQDGVAYFTSAGNSGNLSAGEAGVFEDDYAGAALPGPLAGAGNSAHDYGGGDVANEVTMDSPFFFTLQWADPTGGATNDYDLFLLDAALANVIAASTSTQNGTQNPFEIIDTTASDDTGSHLVVVQFAGNDRYFHLNTHRGRLEHGTDGQIFGHPGTPAAITIAAVDVATAAGGVFTGGAANPVEFFSSDGPRRFYFEPDGTPIGAAAGGATTEGLGDLFNEIDKPEFTAADGVSTATPGFNPFFGTSASAPHAAAIAILISEVFPDRIMQEVRNLLRNASLDIEDSGFDFDSGFGIPRADQAFDAPIFSDGFESGNTSAWTNN